MSNSQQNYLVTPWRVGMELFDLHYGWHLVYRECDVAAGSVVQWRRPYASAHTYPVTQAFSAFLASVARSAERSYSNKMLMLIAEPEDEEGWWTAAFSYDGIRQGVCRIKPKAAAPTNTNYAGALNTSRQSVKARR